MWKETGFVVQPLTDDNFRLCCVVIRTVSENNWMVEGCGAIMR